MPRSPCSRIRAVGVQHRFGDAGIGAAAAEIAAHRLAHPFGIVAGLGFAYQPDRTHDLAGGTEAALEPVMLDERGLHRMQRVAVRHAFDGQDIGAVVAERQRKAGIHPPAVEQHGAGAALAPVAALLRPGEIEPLTQQIEQGDTRIVDHNDLPTGAVHRQ